MVRVCFLSRRYRATFWLDLCCDVALGDLEEELLLMKRFSGKKRVGQALPTCLAGHLPKRLWLYVLGRQGRGEGGGEGAGREGAGSCGGGDLAESVYGEWKDAALRRLAGSLKRLEVPVAGKGPFKEEFVTAGGVDLREVDLRTMQSKRVPGLYFAGEILNVDGVTGGFNFQNAWTSGHLAGSDVAATTAAMAPAQSNEPSNQ